MLVLRFSYVNTTYSVLSGKLVIIFSTFSNFILLGTMVSYYDDHVIFQDTEHQLQENIV